MPLLSHRGVDGIRSTTRDEVGRSLGSLGLYTGGRRPIDETNKRGFSSGGLRCVHC
jgi:hypothetical protein